MVWWVLPFCWLAFDLPAGAAASPISVGADKSAITNVVQFWQKMTDSEERSQQQRVRMDLLIYYCDTNWNVYWGSSDGTDTFLPLKGMPKSFRFGDRIRVDGWALPVNQEILWDKTSVRLLSQSNHIAVIPADGKLRDTEEFKSHFVKLNALVLSCKLAQPDVLKLDLFADNLNLDGFVQLNQSIDATPNWVGKTLEIQGVFSPKRDAFGAIANIAVWVPDRSMVRVVGSLDNDPRFSDVPLVTSEHFAIESPHTLVRVAGIVHSQQPGESVTIWDKTGQIRILARQRQLLQPGDRIEAIGYPAFLGMEHILQSGLFRLVRKNDAAIPGVFSDTNQINLRLADEIRSLDQETLMHHPPAHLQGVVTCVAPKTNFIFVQDSSGGIRVMQPRLESGRLIQPGMLVTVEGKASNGDFAPVIQQANVVQAGSMDLPDAPVISLEQALTGSDDGRWIQMRGYVRWTAITNGALELHLTAPGGEFIARQPVSEAGIAPPGSIVSVRGVCVADANSRRQLTGIEIWSDTPETIQTEQFPPSDLFAVPMRSLASLRQFNPFNTLNKRVRTAGIVTLQVPGRYLYLQDGDDSLLALSGQTNLFQPGDRVEIVGFPGNNSGNFLLREAVCRRIAAGQEPKPKPITSLNVVDEELDGLLVKTQGTLLDVLAKPGNIHLIIQAQGHIFEAKLNRFTTSGFTELLPGSTLAVIGVYQIQRDEYGKPLSFLLNLRGSQDIHVLNRPPWWTLRRLWMVLLGTIPLFLLVLFSALLARRKNRQLQAAQVELQSAHDQLENRVQERTRELNEEANARKNALDRLSEAQQRLIHASRQAGMAEMATGILHNVGNILNSINVSASMIGDSVQRLRIEQFSKAAELLQQHNGNLADFLQNDPRGRALPGYLRQLADSMTQNGLALNTEVQSLAKQLDHIKAVVAWQQDRARGHGFHESLDPVELMEDALQINRSAYDRHEIEVVREFEEVPTIVADRHKVLQILINVFNNAKQSMAAAQKSSRRVILRIHPHGADRVRLEVADNGVGIAPENLDLIFSLGFTTKPDGHGFGLHSGANSAKEMGGRLFALSEGISQGATFVLDLPVAPRAGNQANEAKLVETKSS